MNNRVIVALLTFVAVYNAVLIFLFISPPFLPVELFRAEGVSMEPAIHSNDVVVVLKGDAEVGDVATFRYFDETVSHRVIKVFGDYILTKGDNADREDPITPRENVIGKVIMVLPPWLVFAPSIILPGSLWLRKCSTP